jgi:hypothetical protein
MLQMELMLRTHGNGDRAFGGEDSSQVIVVVEAHRALFTPHVLHEIEEIIDVTRG